MKVYLSLLEYVTAEQEFLFLTHYRPAMPSGNRNIFEDLFSSVLSQFRKYNPSRNLNFNNFDIFQSLELRILMGKNLTSLTL